MDVNESIGPENTGLTRGRLAILAAIFLLIPHTLYYESSSAVDNSYTSWTLIALLWGFGYIYGSRFSGPFSGVFLSLPEGWQLILTAGVLLPSIFLVWTFYRYSLGNTNIRLRLRVILVAVVILIVSGGFSYTLDGWRHTLAIPFPPPPIVGLLSCVQKTMIHVVCPHSNFLYYSGLSFKSCVFSEPVLAHTALCLPLRDSLSQLVH